MSGQDAELEQLRHGISCAALLERGQPAWSLDKRGSTRRALKYRRGPGEVVIVNHDGRGWWDPHSAAKGDVFDLACEIASNHDPTPKARKALNARGKVALKGVNIGPES